MLLVDHYMLHKQFIEMEYFCKFSVFDIYSVSLDQNVCIVSMLLCRLKHQQPKQRIFNVSFSFVVSCKYIIYSRACIKDTCVFQVEQQLKSMYQ